MRVGGEGLVTAPVKSHGGDGKGWGPAAPRCATGGRRSPPGRLPSLGQTDMAINATTAPRAGSGWPACGSSQTGRPLSASAPRSRGRPSGCEDAGLRGGEPSAAASSRVVRVGARRVPRWRAAWASARQVRAQVRASESERRSCAECAGRGASRPGLVGGPAGAATAPRGRGTPCRGGRLCPRGDALIWGGGPWRHI